MGKRPRKSVETVTARIEGHCDRCGGAADSDSAWCRRCRIDVLTAALRGLMDDEPCRYDHAGYCQTHSVSKPCVMAAARTALAPAREVAERDPTGPGPGGPPAAGEMLRQTREAMFAYRARLFAYCGDKYPIDLDARYEAVLDAALTNPAPAAPASGATPGPAARRGDEAEGP